MTLGMTHEAEYLREISFISTFKFCNRAAHALAMEAQLIEGPQVWLQDFPPSLLPIVNNDISI